MIRFFREFFGDRAPQPAPERRREGLGSGVIVRQDGYVLTNHHVIDGAERIKVVLSDNRTLEARVVGSDPPSDLAVLKLDASGLPVLSLGDSDRTRVGDVVLAIGNPLGVGQTVTMGIISAKGRQTGLSNGSFEDFLQTDAPINQGNSGGRPGQYQQRAGWHQFTNSFAFWRKHWAGLCHPVKHGAHGDGPVDQYGQSQAWAAWDCRAQDTV